MPSFNLRKWYLDVVTPAGEGAIVYHAALRWRGIVMKYGEVIRFGRSGPSTQRSTLRPGIEPRLELLSAGETRVQCEIRPLGVRGDWLGRAAGMTLRLWDSPSGNVEWNCCVPSARASVEVGGDRLVGAGYIERLDMTLPPWQFPSDELRWGRVVAERSWAVWIGWRGGADRVWVAGPHGVRTAGRVDDGLVETDDVRVEIESPRVAIRDAELGQSLRGPAAMLRHVMPRRVLSMHETKWLSRARFRCVASAEPEAAWVVHELVRMAPRGAS